MGQATEDAPQASAQAAAPTKRPVWKQWLWLAGRVGVTVGAVGFALAAWMPWFAVSGYANSDVNQPRTLRLGIGDIDAFPSPFGWAALSVLAILVLPFLWSRIQSAASVLITALVFAMLLFFAGTFTVTSTNLLSHHAIIRLADDLTPQELWVSSTEPRWLFGYWSTYPALGIALIGAVLIASAALASREVEVIPSRSMQTAPRLRRVPGAGWLTLGLVVFLLGILEMGWAAVNCTATPLFIGQCNGLSFSGVLHYGIATHTDAFDPVAALYAIPTLLVGGAALALVGVWWWRRLTPGLCLWITLYLAVATFFFVVAYAGVGAIVTGASALGLQAGHWTGQIGIVIAGAGLVIGWGATVVLWVRALRPGAMEVVTPSRP